jgi:MTH538 TIR-like domain (DUF1863)
MSFKVFISYRFSDAEIARTVEVFFHGLNGLVPGTPKFVYVSEPSSEEDIMQAIRRVMEMCQAVLLVVGDDSHNGPWIEYEIDSARQLKLPLVAIQLPNSRGALPQRVRNSTDVQHVRWDQKALASALNAIVNQR